MTDCRRDRREAISRELDRTEQLRSAQRRSPLEKLAAQIERDAAAARATRRECERWPPPSGVGEQEVLIL